MSKASSMNAKKLVTDGIKRNVKLYFSIPRCLYLAKLFEIQKCQILPHYCVKIFMKFIWYQYFCEWISLINLAVNFQIQTLHVLKYSRLK